MRRDGISVGSESRASLRARATCSTRPAARLFDRRACVYEPGSVERGLTVAARALTRITGGPVRGTPKRRRRSANVRRHRTLRHPGVHLPISAATPATCGEAMDVPLIQT